MDTTPATPESSTGPRKTVIVADDTEAIRDRFAAALRKAGHEAVTVRSAAELLARVRMNLDRIALLLLDLRLSHQSGTELVQSIRKIDGGRLPIVAFGGTVRQAEEVRELAALGVIGYMNEHCADMQIVPSLSAYLH